MTKRGRRRTGFTLVELLVVVAIIGIIIMMLFPLIGKARERARRTACGANIRAQIHATISWAMSDAGRLPKLHSASANPYWFTITARDTLTKSYGIQRKNCYCPSNRRDWDFENFWNWNGGGTESVWGYCYMAEDGTGTMTKWAPVKNQNKSPNFATLLSDKPAFTVLWIDLNRRYGAYNWFGPDTRRGANHFGQRNPDGANVGYIDGHSEWVEWNRMEERVASGGSSIFW